MTTAYAGTELEDLAGMVRYQGWIVDLFAPALRGRMLEVGAGLGSMSERLLPHVEQAVLVEPDAAMAERMAQRFAARPAVQVATGALETLCAARDARLAAHSFDCAVSVNVLEHVEDDVGLLTTMAGLLKPGGAVLTFVPALPALFGSLDALVEHRRRYTRDVVVQIHERAGLRVEQVGFVDALGALPWLVAGRALKRRRFDRAAALLWDRVFVDLSRRCDSLLSRFWGKNLYVIARPAAGG